MEAGVFILSQNTTKKVEAEGISGIKFLLGTDQEEHMQKRKQQEKCDKLVQLRHPFELIPAVSPDAGAAQYCEYP